MVYDEGKVYLRDVRSKNIYLYERHLAANKNFQPCVPNPVKQPHEEGSEQSSEGSE